MDLVSGLVFLFGSVQLITVRTKHNIGPDKKLVFYVDVILPLRKGDYVMAWNGCARCTPQVRS